MYRTVDTATWDDPWVTDLRPLDKLLFFYLLTNRRSTACGVFEITLQAISFETGLHTRQATEGLARLSPKILWWPAHRVIFVRNFFKHQSSQSNVSNFTAAAAKKLLDFPSEVRDAVVAIYPSLYKEDTHTHPIPKPPPTLGDKVTVEVEVEETVEVEGDSARTSDAPATPIPFKRPKNEPEAQETSFPSSFAVTADMEAWAKKHLPELDIGLATEQWSDAMRANRTKYRYTDWTMAWYNGMRTAAKWNAANGGNSNGTHTQGQLRADQQGGSRQLTVPKKARTPKTFGRSLENAQSLDERPPPGHV
jgi:hypothetical protein